MKSKKAIAISFSMIILILAVLFIWVRSVRSNAVSAAVDAGMHLAEEMNCSDTFNVEQNKGNLFDLLCDVLITNDDNTLQIWYRVENDTAYGAAINRPHESGKALRLADSSKERQLQYDVLNYVKQNMYTAYIVITDTKEENDIYIVTMSIPDRQQEITARVDTGSKDENGNYNNITLSEQ